MIQSNVGPIAEFLVKSEGQDRLFGSYESWVYKKRILFDDKVDPSMGDCAYVIFSNRSNPNRRSYRNKDGSLDGQIQ